MGSATTPLMTAAEVIFFQRAFAWYEEPLRVFEWGSGRSTIYFPKLLLDKGVGFTWTAIESDRRWFELVKRRVTLAGLRSVSLKLVEFDGAAARRREVSSDKRDAYVQSLAVVAPCPHLILIDGRFRRRCLELARRRVTERSLIVLMDAERRYYGVPEDGRPGILLDTGLSSATRRRKPKQIWVELRSWQALRAFKEQVDLRPVDRAARRSYWLHELRFALRRRLSAGSADV